MGYPTFAVGDVLAASDMNAVGLWKITKTSFTTQTNADITGVFSSSYDHYIAVFDFTTSLTGQYTHIQLLNGTTPKTTNYVRTGFVATSASVLGADAGGSGTSGWAIAGQSTTGIRATATFYLPNVNTRTGFVSSSIYAGPSNTQIYSGNGEQTENYVATGFRITANGNAATQTGSVTIYGYRI